MEIKKEYNEYRANFLWPAKNDSIEEAGYEFANGKTEQYQEQWWEILKERIKIQSGATELLEALKSYAECSDGCTCGDGWSHEAARVAISKAKGESV